MTEKQMQVMLREYLMKKNRKYILPNIQMWTWEADLICYTQANYCHELEIKVTRSDFLQDYKKRKHMYLDGRLNIPTNREWYKTRVPNYFWYVCPWGMIEQDEIPEHAGLIWINPDSPVHGSEEVWPAPLLHKTKIDEERTAALLQACSWRMWTSYDKIAKLEKKLKEKNGQTDKSNVPVL